MVFNSSFAPTIPPLTSQEESILKLLQGRELTKGELLDASELKNYHNLDEVLNSLERKRRVEHSFSGDGRSLSVLVYRIRYPGY